MKKFTILTVLFFFISQLFAFPSVNTNTPPYLNFLKEQSSSKTLHWIQNEGQFDDNIAFFKTGSNKKFTYLKDGTIVYQIQQEHKSLVIKEVFNHTNPELNAKGLNPKPTRVSYLGNKHQNTFSGISTFGAINIESPWKGIDVILNSTAQNIEKFFILKKEADVRDIDLSIEDVDETCIDTEGALQMDFPHGSVYFTKPVAWQEIDGNRSYIEVAYTVSAEEQSYGFNLGSYDPDYEVIIDPLLNATFLGGNMWDYIEVMKIGKSGKVYVAGKSSSPDMPTTANAYDDSYNNQLDMFLGLYSKDLTILECCTYLGGMYEDYLQDIVLDTADNVYLTGSTSSFDYPVTNDVYDNTFNNPNDQWSRDIVITAVSADLQQINYSTFFGSSNDEYAWSIDMDSSQNVFITGYSWVPIPQVGIQFSQLTQDFIFLKFDRELKNLLATNSLTGYDGTIFPDPGDIVVDSSQNLFIVAETTATNLPTSDESFSQKNYGGTDLYMFRLSNDLSTLLASSYIGGTADEHAYCVITDTLNNVIISGATGSKDFPLDPNGVDILNEGLEKEDAVIFKLDSNLMYLTASTLLGGRQDEHAYDLTLGPDSNIYVTGFTDSENFPVLCNSYDKTFNGMADAFGACLGWNLDTLIASSYFGGSAYDYAYSIVLNQGDSVFISGYTSSEDFPMKTLSIDSLYNGGPADGFALMINKEMDQGFPCCTELISPSPFSMNNPKSLKLEWDHADGATGYRLSLGTASNSYNLLTNFEIIGENSYSLLDLNCGDSIFVKIEPFNSYGKNHNCTETWFVVHEEFHEIETVDICEGESYLWQGMEFNSPGTHTVEFVDIFGCDSIHQLDLMVFPDYYQYEAVEICEDDFYMWQGTPLYVSGNYIETYTSINGCDSIFELDLLAHPVFEFFESASICDGETYDWQGYNLTASGNYTANLQSNAGCDSTIHLELSIFDSYDFYDTLTVCPGDVIDWHDEFYDSPGDYQAQYLTINGCDSTYHLSLTTFEDYQFNEDQEICSGSSLDWHEMTLSVEGMYSASYVSQDGCDSSYFLNLTVIDMDTSITIFSDTLSSNESNASSYQWLTCPDLEPIEGATEHFYVADSSGSYAVILEVGGCIDTSACFHIIHSGSEELNGSFEFFVYPNPLGTNELNISIEESPGPIQIEILNIQGTVLKDVKSQSSKITLDISDIASGIYLVRVEKNNKYYYKKLLINK